MIWPNTLTLIRHDESAYNRFKKLREQDPQYKVFKDLFDKNPSSPDLVLMARELQPKLKMNMGDHATPLAPEAGFQAEEMARKLKDLIKLPDVVFVSPYKRTQHTLYKMQLGWPELKNVKTVEEDRIREKEHGLENFPYAAPRPARTVRNGRVLLLQISSR